MPAAYFPFLLATATADPPPAAAAHLARRLAHTALIVVTSIHISRLPAARQPCALRMRMSAGRLFVTFLVMGSVSSRTGSTSTFSPAWRPKVAMASRMALCRTYDLCSNHVNLDFEGIK